MEPTATNEFEKRPENWPWLQMKSLMEIGLYVRPFEFHWLDWNSFNYCQWIQ